MVVCCHGLYTHMCVCVCVCVYVSRRTAPQPLAVITSMRNGQLHELTTGEEFFISYMSSCTPLAAFLNFGFVPPELLSRAAVAPAVSTGTQATQRGERGSVLQGARSGRQDSGHGGRDDGDWSWPGFSAM